MRKLFIGCLLLLVLVATPACSSEPESPPTDIPRYSEGEAIAIVQASLRGDMPSYADIAEVGSDNWGLAEWLSKERNRIQAIIDGSWQCSYEGDGKWGVFVGPIVANSKDIEIWFVYETTGMVEKYK